MGPVSTEIAGNFTTLLLHPLSTILNYHCMLVVTFVYTYIVIISSYLNVFMNLFNYIYKMQSVFSI